jgi:hypothetical protein
MFFYKDGNLFRKSKPKGRSKPIDQPIGSIDKVTGYIKFQLKGKNYRVHRLIYLMVHKTLPKYIDHINGNRADNRIENLREASKTNNNQNSSIRSDNTSGTRGVSWNSQTNSWRVTIYVEGKQKHLGLFKDLELATLVAEEASIKFYKEFSPINSRQL